MKDAGDRQVENEFEKASQQADESFLAEFVSFLKYNKKWWMTPIFIVLGLLTLLVFFTASPVAPFIYSLF